MTRLSLAEAQANLPKLVESAVTTHERFELTRNGERVAVLLSVDDYDSLLETLDPGLALTVRIAPTFPSNPAVAAPERPSCDSSFQRCPERPTSEA